MARKFIREATRWLRRAVNDPRQELNRWQRAARYAYDLGRYGARQLREDRAPQIASALAFRTLFALAPVLIVATIIAKALRGTEAIMTLLRSLLAAAGLDRIQVGTVNAPELAADQAALAPAATMSLADWLEGLTDQLIHTNLAAIGWIGVGLIVYAAIALMVIIENSFNVIYRASNGRPWTRRVPLYWFILTLSPVVIGVGAYIGNQFDVLIASVGAWQSLVAVVSALWSFVVWWLFLFAVYTLIPNATVAVRPALAGAFVATVLLLGGKHTLAIYLGNAFSINQLQGTLGLVPLFMFWVYLMWLAVLFGLQVSSTLQMLRGRALDEVERPKARTGLVDPTVVLTVMEVMTEKFSAGQAVTALDLAETTSLPEPALGKIVDRLVQDGWLYRVEQPDAGLCLAKPPAQMPAAAFIELGFAMVDEGLHGRVSSFANRIRKAQQDAVAGITLAECLRERNDQRR